MCRFVVIPVMFILAQCATAQDTIPVYQEPYHHLVFQNDAIRILDVRLDPGDTSAWHIHRDAITYIGLEGSRIWLDVPGEHPRSVYLPDDFWGGDTDYPESSFVHRIANVGFQPFRLLAVEHLLLQSERPLETNVLEGGETLDINPYFSIHRLRVDARSTQDHILPGPVLLICRGQGQILMQGSEGTVSLDHGNWLVWPQGSQLFSITNPSTVEMEILVLFFSAT